MGTRSNPIQNFGGIGLSSRSSLALVAGSVNGSGTELPKSAVEQETPIRAKAAPISDTMTISWSPLLKVFSCLVQLILKNLKNDYQCGDRQQEQQDNSLFVW